MQQRMKPLFPHCKQINKQQNSKIKAIGDDDDF